MEKTYTIPQRMLTNTVAVLNGYETRLEGAIDVLATIPPGRRLVEPHTKLLAVVHELAEFYSELKKQPSPAPEPRGKSLDEALGEFNQGVAGLDPAGPMEERP